jgi:electron transport complex protein RnfG
MCIKHTFCILLFLLTLLLAGCGENPAPTESELAALNEIFAENYSVDDYKVITDEVMTAERQKKFEAVKKVYTTPKGDYAFISKPVAYNGPITLAVGIDREKKQTIGMRIVEHVETEHYVRDMYNSWFTQRFAGKSSDVYLEPVHLEASRDNEIIIITGATVTTEGITNGVNACLGLFREVVSGKNAEAVPYMVKFERAEGEGPEETGTIAIRAYGVILGEVTLEQIREMPAVTRTVSIHSTTGTSRHKFRGISQVFEPASQYFDFTSGFPQFVFNADNISNIIGLIK